MPKFTSETAKIAAAKGRRPKNVDTRKMKALINAQAMGKLEGLLGKAYDVLDERLDEGSESAAIYVLEKLTGKNSTLLPAEVPIKLSTIDDVLLAAQTVTEMSMMRKMSVDDATKALNMLSQYAAFRAFDRIDELQTVVEEMKRVSEAKTVNSHAVTPSWGRLSEGTPTANTKERPAE